VPPFPPPPHRPPHRPARRWLATLATSAALLLAGCGTAVVNPVTGQTERTVMDEQAEIAEGRKAHAQVLAETPAYAHPQLQAYVSQLGQKLVANSHRANLSWTFTVLDSPEVNAFALPGGYVYVTRGILAYLDNEAELAGVIGHEIGHVTARHGAQRATRAQRAGVGVMAAVLLGAVAEAVGVGGATDLAARASQGVAAGYVASYSREQELQADQLGAEYLARSHYNPRNMVDVIGVLKDQERYAADQARAEGKPAPSGANWLSSHPSNDRRLADITEIAGRYSGSYGDDGRARYLQAIEGVVFGDSVAQGVLRNGHFVHPGLDIGLALPTGWQLRNEPSTLWLINAAGDAGLLLRLAPAEAGSTHEAVVRQLFKPTESRAEPRTLGGLAATAFSGQRRNAQGQAVPFRLTVATAPGGELLLLQPVSRDAAALQRSAPAIAEAEASLHRLSAAERSAARPWVLASAAMPSGGWAALAPQTPFAPAQAPALLKLLNGQYGGGQSVPSPGQRVKLVRVQTAAP